jgi:hypothetical protein
MLEQSVRALAPRLVERRRSWQCDSFRPAFNDFRRGKLARVGIKHRSNRGNRLLQLLIAASRAVVRQGSPLRSLLSSGL